MRSSPRSSTPSRNSYNLAFVAKKLSIVIPVFNEKATVLELVRRVESVSLPVEKEIVLVDDGSKDGSAELLRSIQKPGVVTAFHSKNRGKGAALKTGFKAATGDFILLQDADLEYNPEDYPTLLAPLLEDKAELVLGSRFAYERPRFFFGKRRSPFFSHYIGNLTITGLTNLLYGGAMTDYYSCYKVIKREVIASFPIGANGFDFDNELVCKSLRRGFRLVEVPIRYLPRSYEEGKKITWVDGISVIYSIVKWRFMPF